MSEHWNRRTFIRILGIGAAALPFAGCSHSTTIPSWLGPYKALYRENPLAASIAWFREAQFGMFIHYGLYSLLGRHEWVLYDERIPIREYDTLENRFTAKGFDADFITDLALEAGMRYVNLVCKHCDSFCLWNTQETDFNSVNSPAGRDLVAEMSETCRRKGLGFFAFYEHGFDWRHPHGPSPWDWDNKAVRPHYDPPEPTYAYGNAYDFQNYLDYVTGNITELLTDYGPLAGIWLDGVDVVHSGDHSKFRLPELYALIRRLQPHALISYKYGIEGTEDFLAPEEQQIKHIRERTDKPIEVCTSLHDGGSTRHKVGWGYVEDAQHYDANWVMDKLKFCRSMDANLLLNIGPLPDGSVHPADIATLREIGHRLRSV